MIPTTLTAMVHCCPNSRWRIRTSRIHEGANCPTKMTPEAQKTPAHSQRSPRSIRWIRIHAVVRFRSLKTRCQPSVAREQLRSHHLPGAVRPPLPGSRWRQEQPRARPLWRLARRMAPCLGCGP